jgi:small subunit ribosomal protein S6
MRRYETFVIIDPDLSQDQREPVVDRVEELINQMDGFLILTDDWGERKLAYDIKKKKRGYYVRFDFCGLAPLVNEIERFFRIDDRALKYMTVLLNKDVDLEKLKEEKAAKEAAAEESLSDSDDSPKEDQQQEPAPAEEAAETDSAPAEEIAVTDADAPTAEAEDTAPEKTPSSTKEEA